jgi:hypothetical protein
MAGINNLENAACSARGMAACVLQKEYVVDLAQRRFLWYMRL